MEAKNILQADLLDILFEGRNKQYGAYDLRKTYNSRIYKALGAMAAVCLLFFAGLLFANSKKVNVQPLVVSAIIDLKSVAEPVKKIIPLQPLKPKVPEVKVVKSVVPKIVPDDKADKVIPPVDEINNSNIGLENKDGIDQPVLNVPVEKTGTGNIPASVKDNKIDFIPIQIEAQFPGGADAWLNFLKHNLRSEAPVENGAPEGTYKVIVSFTVDENGNISDVKAENDPGYGTSDEAVRVIKQSNKWIPAEQNGRKVIYRQKQAVTFVVDENS